MADERTEFEIALKDAISPQLKQIAQQLKALNASVVVGAGETGKGGAETVSKLSRSIAAAAGRRAIGVLSAWVTRMA
jgi:hypothetical protein